MMTEADRKRAKPGRPPKAPLRPQDVIGLKYFKAFEHLLEPLHAHQEGPNRLLHYEDFASLLLLYFLNPVITSLRGIAQASTLRNVKRKLKIRRASLGSLSEASHVFDSHVLHEVFRELTQITEARNGARRPSALSKELEVLAVDGSLLKGLPRMVWALWLDREHRAAKLHLEYDILKGVPKRATITDGRGNEKQVLRESLSSGKLYVLDGGYGEYALLEAIRQAGSSFVVRLHDNAVYEELETRTLSDVDREAGIVFDQMVRLGSTKKRAELACPVRVIRIHLKSPPYRGIGERPLKVSRKKTFRHRPETYDLLIGTDLLECPAETIATLYRYRWTIELFFRWFKCILGFGHLVFESENGVNLLVYCALIVSLLITLWTGRKPTKRTLEMIQFYFQGWAELDELEAHIAALKKIES